MSNFEIGFCSPLEYKLGREKRVQESDLAIDGLYVIMFNLGNTTPTGAAKYPARVRSVDEGESGITPVHFTVLNADLGDKFNATGHLRDGFWLPGSPTKIKIGEKLVQEGYFRDYGAGDETENALQDLISKHTAIATR